MLVFSKSHKFQVLLKVLKLICQQCWPFTQELSRVISQSLIHTNLPYAWGKLTYFFQMNILLWSNWKWKGHDFQAFWSYSTLHWLLSRPSWVKKHESVSVWQSVAMRHSSQRRKKIGKTEFQSSFFKNASLLYTKHSLDQACTSRSGLEFCTRWNPIWKLNAFLLEAIWCHTA